MPLRRRFLLLGVKTGWSYQEIRSMPLRDLIFYSDEIAKHLQND